MTITTEGILPRKSSSVCSLTADLRVRNCAQGKSDRHKSTVVASKAYKVWSSSRVHPCRACVPLGSAFEQSRRRSASRGLDWRSPECCARRCCESPCDKFLRGTQARFDVSETLSISELSKSQSQKLTPGPAGNRLYRNGSHININGFIAMKFRGAKLVCGPCILRQRCCLKTPETTETKQVTIFIGRSEGSKDSPIEKMRRKFDTYLAGSSTTNGSP